MGTNYYYHDKQDCVCCGRSFEPLHIGKSSGGWCFALHVIPEDCINSLDDWKDLFKRKGSYISNEYGEKVPVKEMIKIIENREMKRSFDDVPWTDMGYRSEHDFHMRNKSERGPNNLFRHSIGSGCRRHGKGTWDYIEGEFS